MANILYQLDTESIESIIEQDIRTQIKAHLHISGVCSTGNVMVNRAGGEFLVLGLELLHEVINSSFVITRRAAVVLEWLIVCNVLLRYLLLEKVALVKEQDDCRVLEALERTNVFKQI